MCWSLLIDAYLKAKAKIKEIQITSKRIVLFLSPLIYIWMVWQHEIMLKTFKISQTSILPILEVGEIFPFLDWAWEQRFGFFTGIIVPWGAAYDFTLLGQAIAYLMLFGLVIVLMYEGRKRKNPKVEVKEIEDQPLFPLNG